ncbi:unnamed protein product [Rotaria magnacalcarata]|uniref:Uncharacterized protein n=1 Tax=Rotaria magnacalcarata TaxID=392030 RepID=A0A816VRU2_9BILA|nr:unnamed protein product [Rotaria magnacalcarata]CAF4161080.1 unnamed protein product [Rotaria magnacalcarata]
MASASISNGQPARYFDLVNQPETLKLRNGLLIPASELKDFSEKRSSVPIEWDVNFGDVIDWSNDRPTEAYFVLEDRTLLKNPDRSGSGYLTIPYHVANTTGNVLLKYKYVIESIGKDNVSTIEMHPQDIFIKENWGELPHEILSSNVQFTYDPREEFLYANLPQISKSKEFQLGSTTMNNIQVWFTSTLIEQASFRVKYNFFGPLFQKYHQLYKLHMLSFSLPQTWSVAPGTTDIGHDNCHGEWIFQGDRQHLKEAKQNVHDFYKDLPYKFQPSMSIYVSLILLDLFGYFTGGGVAGGSHTISSSPRARSASSFITRNMIGASI